MSAYVILRGAALKLCAERAAEAPAALYRAACLTCSAQSDLARDEPRPVQVWALGHTQEHGLHHNQFRLTTHRYWRVDPVHAPVGATPWPPPAGRRAPARDAPVPEVPVARHRSGTHAKPRRQRGQRTRCDDRQGVRLRLRSLAAGAARAAGPLLLSVLLLGPALFGPLTGGGRGHHALSGDAHGRGSP
ncbi:DUF7848 domain-containing protein [Streptomyces sp. 4N509B]|uniref:DUF7848 domain-containing protein n=1 Tax=Streptomyces sp. 4N509B TaxID=3457413 RepID=UPI003FD22498